MLRLGIAGIGAIADDYIGVIGRHYLWRTDIWTP